MKNAKNHQSGHKARERERQRNNSARLLEKAQLPRQIENAIFYIRTESALTRRGCVVHFFRSFRRIWL